MNMSIASRIRETALRVPRAQARELFDLADEVGHLEETMNEIVGDACETVLTLDRMRIAGYG